MRVSGTALHSGVQSQVRLFRDDGPTRFLRSGTFIPATLASVVATPRCTVLGANGAQVALVEHLLAALHVTGWWSGVMIEVSAAELPILDGSAKDWLAAIEPLGKPPREPVPLRLERSVGYLEGETLLEALPPEGLTMRELSVSVDFSHKSVGHQSWRGGPKRYSELLAARTFGFVEELNGLRAQGLIRGGGPENAILFADEGPLTPLRYQDEPARHKALDFLGDAYLLGRPLDARLSARRGSHRSHIAFMKQLQRLHIDKDVG